MADMFWSHTRLSDYMTCPKKYLHKRIRKKVIRAKQNYFVEGSAFHAGIDRWYDTGDPKLAEIAVAQEFEEVDTSPLQAEEIHRLENSKAMVLGIMDYYPEYFAGDIDQYPVRMNEVDCMGTKGICLWRDKKEHVSHWYQGKIDGIWQDGAGEWWILETKLLQSFDQNYLDAVTISNQTIGYMHLAKKALGGYFPAGVLYNIVKKPGIRLKKAETRSDYRTRVREWYRAQAEPPFARHEIRIPKQDLQDWKKEIRFLIKNLARKTEKSMWPKYTTSCRGMFGSPCEYLPACRQGRYDALIYKDG